MDWVYLLIFLGGCFLGLGVGWVFRISGKLDDNGRIRNQTLGEAVTALADGDRDSALKMLTNVVARDTEELDAYLTLGILYRRKGWFRRAVDIHRRLLSRPMLDPLRRRQAMIALSRDFEEAGLMGRAIDAIQEVLDKKNAMPEEFAILARLYESTAEWVHAGEAWSNAGSSEKFQNNLAFCRVMEAKRLLKENELKKAVRWFNQALKVDRNNPAAYLCLAEIYARMGKVKQAVQYYEKLQGIRVDLTGVIADSLESIILETGNEGLKTFFLDLMKAQAHKPRVAVRFAAWLHSMGDSSQAVRLIQAIDPSNLSHEILLRLVETAETLGEYELASKVARRVMSSLVTNDRFVCHRCGELMPILEWRCPKCSEWGTIQSRTQYQLDSEGDDSR